MNEINPDLPNPIRDVRRHVALAAGGFIFGLLAHQGLAVDLISAAVVSGGAVEPAYHLRHNVTHWVAKKRGQDVRDDDFEA